MAKPKAPKIVKTGKNEYRVVLGGKVYIFTKRFAAENAVYWHQQYAK